MHTPQLTLLPILNSHHTHSHECGCHHEHKKDEKNSPVKPIKKFTPLMDKIISSKLLSTNQKELLITGSFLTSALPVTKIIGTITKALDLDSFSSSLITAPLAISSMHFINRGNKNLSKLGLILGSSIGGIVLQKAFQFPKSILRSLLTAAVFFIEKYQPDIKENKKVTLEKQDLLKLGKVLATILSVPAILNIPLHKATEAVEEQNNILNKLLGHIGLTAFQILGLTFGFFGFGKMFNYCANKLELNEKAKSIGHTHNNCGQTEGAVEVCAHCGIPGCIDSVTEGITESVESSISFSLFS